MNPLYKTPRALNDVNRTMNLSSFGFLMIRFGLRIMQLGIWSVTAAMCVVVWVSLTGNAENRESNAQLLLGLGLAAPAVLFCLGSFPLLAAPAFSGAKKFAVLIVLLAHLQLVLGLFALPFLFLVFPAIIAGGVGVLFHVCFLLCLNRLSQWTERADLEAATTGLLIRMVTVPVVLSAISAVGFALAPNVASQWAGTIWSTTGVVYLWRYAVLISSVGRAVRDRHSVGNSLHQQSMDPLPL